jgi:hypothetical protein
MMNRRTHFNDNHISFYQNFLFFILNKMTVIYSKLVERAFEEHIFFACLEFCYYEYMCFTTEANDSEDARSPAQMGLINE